MTVRGLLAAALLLVLAACGWGGAPGRAASAYPSTGRAVDALTCRAEGYHRRLVRGDSYASDVPGDRPEDVLRSLAYEHVVVGGADGMLVGFRDDDRVLYVREVDGEAKEALVVERADSSWSATSWAVCDYAELPASVTEAMGIQLWYDSSGTPAPISRVQSFAGPEHCSWESMTMLSLDGSVAPYLREPLPEYAEYLTAPYLAHTTLPADATDTGWSRDGRHLWLARDGRYAYVGTPDSVEAWPRTTGPFQCA